MPSVRAVWVEVAAAALLIAVAVAMRVVNPGVYSGLFDEGIRVEQLFLMSAGYRPFRDIFAAQGPLLLDLLHPWFVLFGQDLVAARWSVGVYSLVGLAGTYWLARLVGGQIGRASCRERVCNSGDGELVGELAALGGVECRDVVELDSLIHNV